MTLYRVRRWSKNTILRYIVCEQPLITCFIVAPQTVLEMWLSVKVMLQLLMITHSDIVLSLVMSQRQRRDQNSKDVTSADNDETSTDSPSDLLLFVDNRAIAPGQLHHRRQKAPNETIQDCLSIDSWQYCRNSFMHVLVFIVFYCILCMYMNVPHCSV